ASGRRLSGLTNFWPRSRRSCWPVLCARREATNPKPRTSWESAVRDSCGVSRSSASSLRPQWRTLWYLSLYRRNLCNSNSQHSPPLFWPVVESSPPAYDAVLSLGNLMPVVRLIVCEKTSRWAVALRQVLRGRPPQIIETCSLTSSMSALAAAPASFVVLDVRENKIATALEWLDQAGRRFSLARLVVALRPEMAVTEVLFREAGAIDVLFATQQAASVARQAQRQLGQIPAEQLNLCQWLAERMPWPAYA